MTNNSNAGSNMPTPKAASFDPTKPFTTRDGREAKIFATNGGGSHPLLGAIRDGNAWVMRRWTLEGRSIALVGQTDASDLINPAPKIKHTGYLIVTRNESGFRVDEKRTFEENPQHYYYQYSHVATVPFTIDCEEGFGISQASPANTDTTVAPPPPAPKAKSAKAAPAAAVEEALVELDIDSDDDED